jgi:hypothetical protein
METTENRSSSNIENRDRCSECDDWTTHYVVDYVKKFTGYSIRWACGVCGSMMVSLTSLFRWKQILRENGKDEDSLS